LSQISQIILEECLADNSKPSGDNLTLMIIDVAAYYNDMLRIESPIRSVFSHKQMRLREYVSEAG